jgi:uncharacterized membrane protein
MSLQGIDVLPTAPRRAPRWLLALGLLLLAGFACRYIASNVFHYRSYDPATYDIFWPRRFGLIPHMLGGTVAVLIGVMQLWLGATGRTGSLHRTLGKVYLGAVALGSIGAFYLAFTIQVRYFPYAIGLGSLATAWVLTSGMAYIAIRSGDIEQHREWMIRSYAVTFAFVTFRIFDNLFISWKIAPEPEVDTAMAFACFAIPLMFIEPILQYRKLRASQ